MSNPKLQTQSTAPSTDFLDGLRGLTALYVCIHHASYSLIESKFLWTLSGQYPLPDREMSPLSALAHRLLPFFERGHAAVIFFFVLSGFVIHLGSSRRPVDQFRTRSFLFRRARRLYPPLLLAVALTVFLDNLGLGLGLAPYYGVSHYEHLNSFRPDLSVITVTGNLVFLMPYCVPVLGTNGPLWSLAYEWWFYAAYPLLFRLCGRSMGLAALAVTAAAAIGIVSGPQGQIAHVLALLPVWWLGAMYANVFLGRIPVELARLWPMSALLLAGMMPSIQEDVRAALMGCGYLGVLSVIFAIQARWPRAMKPFESLGWLGDMSYTLYVLHMPMLIFMSGLLIRWDPEGRLPQRPWAMLGGLAIILGTSYVAHLAVERPFVRRR